MAYIWIEFEDELGPGAARWGDDVPVEQVDAILAFAQKTIGRSPDTVA